MTRVNDAEFAVEVRDLRVEYRTRGSLRRRGGFVAVDGVNFQVPPGTSFGIIGESGSGKSTILRAMLGLVPSTGTVLLHGEPVVSERGKVTADARRNMRMVFQDPFTSLNPRRRVYDILEESMVVAGERSKREMSARISDVIERVGLDTSALRKFPNSFSGGQRQRIGIARALLTDPEVLLLDEPTSALDVSVQAQVLNLLKELQAEYGITYVFISHDLPVVRYMCDQVAVMQRGRFVETGPTETVLSVPSHDFTRQLISAIDPAPATS